jgi:hypothetical protein
MSESPLRQQIAALMDEMLNSDEYENWPTLDLCDEAADAVVALLNLTEERGQRYSEEGSAAGDVVLPGVDLNFPGGYVVHRYVTPWLPSTPPDTSSSDPA